MLFVIFFGIATLGILFHRSKIMRFILVFYTWILMAFNTYNPDTLSYQIIYNNPMSAQEEIGFKLLCLIGKKIGMSYDVFHFFLITLSLIFAYKGINELRKRNKTGWDNLIFVTYLFFPMMFDIVLVRSFVSACIIIYALKDLYDAKYIKYTLFILVAASIHISSVFFLLLLLVATIKRFNRDNCVENKYLFKRIDTYSKRRVCFLVAGVIVLFVFLLRTNILQTVLLNLGFNPVKINLWLSGSNITIRKVLLCTMLHLVNYFTFIFIRRTYLKSSNRRMYSRLDGIVYVLNNILLLNIVFTIYADQFLRILGVGIIINSIYYSCIIQLQNMHLKRLAMLNCSILPAIVMFVFRMFAYYTPYGEQYIIYIFKTILENNVFVNLLR